MKLNTSFLDVIKGSELLSLNTYHYLNIIMMNLKNQDLK